MTTVSISELKAKLSQYLDRVKAGDEVVVTDRGRPVARLTRIEGSDRMEAHLAEMIRTGRIRPPKDRSPLNLRDIEGLPEDPEGISLRHIIEERREGR